MSESIEQKYQKLDHREHIYKLPDTYIGSIEQTTQECFVPNADSNMEFRAVSFVPGFFKIFDEVLVNAIDHKQRDPSVKNIKIEFSKGLSEISIQNDGNGIDICVHQETQKYIPEMLFGHLLTSTNYQDNVKRTTGGKNGYGSKLTNIYSEWFKIETVDANRGLKYVQIFKNNNREICTPKITKYTSKPYTKITFLPDYKKFNLSEGITEDIHCLFKKRVYDTTAVTPADLNVWFNGEKLKIKSFEKYIELYVGKNKISFQEDSRWKVGLVLSPDREFKQISFVNGIWTIKGGKHVDYITTQIIDKIKTILSKFSKTKNKTFRSSQIKDNLWLFIDSVIENPSFSSQTKEELTSKISTFGSSCNIDEKWVDKWMKQVVNEESFMDRIIETIKTDTDKSLKKTDGIKRNIIRGIPKLDDAFLAGTRHSEKCTLILTEGDSAKASVISGLSGLGPKFRETYGVFPLRGKFINVRDIALSKVSANEEVKNLKTILGLQQGKEYTKDNIKELRYGSIALTTDADFDGSHIKGLILNFIHHYWPSLLKIDGFVKTLITPIIKGFRGDKIVKFYTMTEYKRFKEQHKSEKWNFKYYKGLGTSTGKEFKEYFMNINEITRLYSWDTDESLVMAFSKNLSNERKDWLKVYDSDDIIEHSNKIIQLSDFVNKDLKHFSNYDNIRSIPNLFDGLKPSQRKVLFGIFKKNKGEIKVAQLASFVSEQTNYHHGEVSLEQTIVGLAQNFMGKNNIPLLQPKGQFGTIAQGGKDHAQSRYIFTELFGYTKHIFNEADNYLLEYNIDEEKTIEPKNYEPIIPLVLINGAEGIGTGYSTFIPNFNPNEIITELIDRNMTGKEIKDDWIPWYKHFKGKIERIDSKKFSIYGKYEIIDRKLIIEELPVGVWTQPYKEFLESQIEQGVIQQYIDKSTDINTYFEITLVPGFSVEKVEQHFKLSSKISLNNMYLYINNEIQKFESIKEVVDIFYENRLSLYSKRKKLILKKLKDDLQILEEKIRFIRLVCETPEVVFRKTKNIIESTLKEMNYKYVSQLLNIPIYWWSEEKIQELTDEFEKILSDLEKLEATTPQELWTNELYSLQKELAIIKE